MKTLEEKQAFYAKCAEILNIPHVFHVPVRRKTRWNTRFLGNGRYPGFGLVQCYGCVVRVVSKQGTKVFNDYDAVYDYLNTVVQTVNPDA
jgi:hypothetical protein